MPYDKNQQALLDFATSIDEQEFLSDVEQHFRDAISGYIKLVITYDRVGQLDLLGHIMLGILQQTKAMVQFLQQDMDGDDDEE
jgi:hypothetical protein